MFQIKQTLKMKTTFCLISILIFNFVYGQEKTTQFYPNSSQIKSVGLKDSISGYKKGFWEYFYKNGKLESKGSYSGTLDFFGYQIKEGQWVEFYENGNKKRITNIENEKNNGILEAYYEDGKKKLTANFVNNDLHGAFNSYYKNGQLAVKATFNKDNLSGLYYKFYDNGNPKSEFEYNEIGELIKVVKILDRNGKKLDKGTFLNGNGILYVYDNNGLLDEKVNFKNGKPTKEYKSQK